jgi:phosphopantothenoylcysteine decarboxylase / phosphopantothenate---cysteine ligase
MTVDLVKNPDILASLNGSFVKIGFAAESEDLIKNAQGKLAPKGLDLIVANDITRTDAGFGSDDNQVVLIGRDGRAEELPLMSKADVADRILDRLVELLRAR